MEAVSTNRKNYLNWMKDYEAIATLINYKGSTTSSQKVNEEFVKKVEDWQRENVLNARADGIICGLSHNEYQATTYDLMRKKLNSSYIARIEIDLTTCMIDLIGNLGPWVEIITFSPGAGAKAKVRPSEQAKKQARGQSSGQTNGRRKMVGIDCNEHSTLTDSYCTPKGNYKVQIRRPHLNGVASCKNAVYFYKERGIAMHSGKLPGWAASHGCVRLMLPYSKMICDNVLVGVTEVKVYGEWQNPGLEHQYRISGPQTVIDAISDGYYDTH